MAGLHGGQHGALCLSFSSFACSCAPRAHAHHAAQFCWDSKSCTMRYQTVPYYMSSANWAPQMSQPGIFSTVESESSFWNVNKVYMKYCSSDLWMGDVAASNATFGYAFRGRRIVHAVITSLIQDRGMVAGHRMLYGGCSAGAIGAMINMDQVAGLAGSYGVQVRGLLDAAALVDVYSTGWAWSPSLVPLQTLVSQLVENLQPPLPSTCASRGYFGKAAWKCFFPAFRMPLLETLFHANVVSRGPSDRPWVGADPCPPPLRCSIRCSSTIFSYVSGSRAPGP